MGNYRLFIWLIGIAALISCNENNEELPYLGPSEQIEKTVNGETVTETRYHTIPEFEFMDQDSNIVNKSTVAGKIYVADMFFTSCPTICPIVKSNMLRMYERYYDDPDFMLLSHSIDTKYDEIPTLKNYAEKLEIETNKWRLLKGTRPSISAISKAYFIAAQEDLEAPGGYSHSGGIALIDKEGHIRAMYDGTKKKEVDQLMLAIDRLKATYNTEE
ncbi:MAG: SCO family protein [Bacteroidota bacterium]